MNLKFPIRHKHGLRKLEFEEAETIRQLLAQGISGISIADQYKISRATISRIKLGRFYKRDRT